MKKIYTLFLFCFLTVSAFSQVAIEWQKSFGGPGWDAARILEQTADGGYIMGGESNADGNDVTGNHGFFDYWVVKIDSSGNIQWQKSLGGTGADYLYSIVQTDDGGYIAAGRSVSNDGDVTGNHGTYDYWVVKLDGGGNIQWQKSLGGSGWDEAHAIQQTSDGGYIAAGFAESLDGDVTGVHDYSDYWIAKLDSSGNIEWQKAFGGFDEDEAYAIQQTSDGGYIVAGSTLSDDGDVTGHHGDYDYWIVKIDSAGNMQWQKTLGGSSEDIATSVQQTIDGGYIVAGNSISADGDVTNNKGGSDYWVVKLDVSGNIQWQKSFGGTDYDYGSFIRQTSDGGYIVSGGTSSNDGDVTINFGDYDFWILKLNNAGNIIWEKSLGGSMEEFAFAVHQTADGGFITAGYTNSQDGDITVSYGNYDFWVVKLTVPTSVSSDHNENDYSIYPNPATGEVNILFTLNKTTYVELQLLNSLGQIVKVILNEHANTGENKINLFTGNIPPGIYHLKFVVDNKVLTKKLVKM